MAELQLLAPKVDNVVRTDSPTYYRFQWPMYLQCIRYTVLLQTSLHIANRSLEDSTEAVWSSGSLRRPEIRAGAKGLASVIPGRQQTLPITTYLVANVSTAPTESIALRKP